MARHQDELFFLCVGIFWGMATFWSPRFTTKTLVIFCCKTSSQSASGKFPKFICWDDWKFPCQSLKMPPNVSMILLQSVFQDESRMLRTKIFILYKNLHQRLFQAEVIQNCYCKKNQKRSMACWKTINIIVGWQIPTSSDQVSNEKRAPGCLVYIGGLYYPVILGL